MPEDPVFEAEIAPAVAAVLAVLRRAREHRGWTLNDLSVRLDGITAQHLKQLEEGATDLHYLKFLQICRALELEPKSVVTQAYAK